MHRLATALPLVIVACGGAGLGQGVRQDVQQQMATVESPISACYEEALQRNRKLRGRMLVSFQAEPRTGQFDNVQILRTEVADPQLEACVVQAVRELKLSFPQKTVVAVDYPLDFAPTN